jgi:glycosyltransferase involved in cell wall biosynthesis
MSLSCERQLREFAQINQLESSIYFTGAVNNVADYLQCADIFLFPSRTEALGLALIEANSCGIPAIGTRVGGIPDVIKDGVSGTLVEPDNDDQLYDATVELITNQEKREKMGLSARQIVLEKFTLFGVRQSYESLFENVLSSKG